MEAANKGAQEGASPSIGLNIKLPMEEGHNEYQDISVDFRHFLRPQGGVCQIRERVRRGPRRDLARWMSLPKCSRSFKPAWDRRIPVISGWAPSSGNHLVDWMRNQQLGQGLISTEDLDLDLFLVTDDQQAVIDVNLRFLPNPQL